MIHLLASLFLGGALFLSFAFVVSLAAFTVNGSAGKPAKIAVGQLLRPALLWALFYLFHRMQGG